jgi:hypothetical protein
MADKLIQVLDSATYRNLPGNTGALNVDTAAITDTVFGQSYDSMFPGIAQWTLTANAFYKGMAGYKAIVKKTGTTTSFTAEACTLVSGKTYRITNATKSIWDRSVALTVLDNAVAVSGANILSVNYLFGEVTFVSGYTVVGPITVTGSFLPVTTLCKWNKLTLNMTAAVKDVTDNCQAATNGGYRVKQPGLRQVKLDLSGFYDSVTDWKSLIGAGEIIIEIRPDNIATGSVARGFFQLMSVNQSGNVGATEDESISFNLFVPENMFSVFEWRHGAGTLLSLAVQKLLSLYLAGTVGTFKYLPDGVAGKTGDGVVTDISLSTGLDQAPTFAVTVQGSGGLTNTP